MRSIFSGLKGDEKKGNLWYLQTYDIFGNSYCFNMQENKTLKESSEQLVTPSHDIMVV